MQSIAHQVKYYSMKHIKKLQFLLGALILVTAGCTNSDPTPSAKESLQNSLVNSTWVIDVNDSNISGVSGDPDVSTVTVQFAKTDTGVSFTFGGDISTLIYGGQFDIADNGTHSNLLMDVDSGLMVNESRVNGLTEAFFKISFTTGVASGRVEGIGSYSLTFNTN